MSVDHPVHDRASAPDPDPSPRSTAPATTSALTPEIRLKLLTALIAGVFSLAGVALGVFLNQWTSLRITEGLERQQMATLVAQRAQGRWIRAQTVTMMVGSSKFESRWDDYVLNGVTAWSQDYHLMDRSIEKHFPEAQAAFDRLQESFRELHQALLTYHRSSGQPAESDQLTAKQIKDRVGTEVRELVDLLLTG